MRERTWLEYCCLLNIGDTPFSELVLRWFIILQICTYVDPFVKACRREMAENLDI